MDRVVINQLTVDRLTRRQVDRLTCSYVNLIYGTERLRVVVNSGKVDRVVVNQLTVDRLTGRQVDRFIC